MRASFANLLAEQNLETAEAFQIMRPEDFFELSIPIEMEGNTKVCSRVVCLCERVAAKRKLCVMCDCCASAEESLSHSKGVQARTCKKEEGGQYAPKVYQGDK